MADFQVRQEVSCQMDKFTPFLGPGGREIPTLDNQCWGFAVFQQSSCNLQHFEPSVEINCWCRETKVGVFFFFFQALSCPGQLGQCYERTFSASAAFRACVLSESAKAKWSLLVACHLRVAISCMCLVGCQPLVRQTLVREPLFVMN